MDILFWYWWVAGLLLLALEAFFPGAVFLWMGASALVTGTLAWAAPGLPGEWALALFGALSIASFFAYRRFKPASRPTDQPHLNRRGAAYVGRTLTLTEPIVNGLARVRVDDSQWRIKGPDLPSGTQVTVVAVEGATLVVQAQP